MADETHFRVMDAALMHPDGRARGGESCVVCGQPVPASAHWKQRDRHVCSSRCNHNLTRRFNRGSSSITAERRDQAVSDAGPRPNPRTSGPRVFRTVTNPGPDQLPIEWEGYGPVEGDVVERFGIRTTYFAQDMPTGWYTDRAYVAVAMDNPAQRHVSGATADGFMSRLTIGPFDENGMVEDGVFNHTFQVGDVTCRWRLERVTDLHPDGVFHFTWDCYAAAPVDVEASPAFDSPRYRAEMDRRRRVSDNTARHERRTREQARIEQFDPLDVYERDAWFCQLCGSPVDRTVLHPDPFSASLDHVVPLSRGGDHTRANTVLAHLRCNIRKSNRVGP